MVDHLEASSVRVDADSIEFSVSTRGIVTYTVKRYTDWTMGKSVMDFLTPELMASIEAKAQALKAMFKRINPEA